MNDIYYDLIEKYEGTGEGGRASDEEILFAAKDSTYFCALSPDRINALESLNWNSCMKVLIVGADYGIAAPLCSRLKRLDIADPEEERLFLIKKRYPGLLESGKLRLINSISDTDYDAAVIDLSVGDLPKEYGNDIRELTVNISRHVKATGFVAVFADNAGSLKLAAGNSPDSTAFYINEADLENIKAALGYEKLEVYYPLPNVKFAKNIYSDRFLPSAGSFKDISDFDFDEVNAVFDEEGVYGSLIEAGVFSAFAPSYIAVYGNAKSPYIPDYVRYNRARSEEYALKTEIIPGAEAGGKNIVRKSALTAAANGHIESFKEKYELLKNETGENAYVLRPEFGESEDGLKFADFDYVKGIELSKLLAEHISGGKAPHDEIETALGIILGGEDGQCHSLDSLFENILVTDEGRYCFIDYEWVSSEAADRSFVRWRILSYWFDAYKTALTSYADKREFLREFGIEDQKAEAFEEKEASFQASVRSGANTDADKFRTKAVTPSRIRELEQRITELTDWNLRLQDEIEEHKAAISKEREVERLSQNHIRNIEKINTEQKNQLEILNTQNTYLKKHQSLLSRMARAFIDRLDAWAPADSVKRKLIHYTEDTLRHPVRQFGLYFTKEGRRFISGDFKIGGEFSEGGILTVPKANAPLVSIVIPAYDQVRYTYACIRSIISNTDFDETPYEIILADDVSQDATREIGSFINNLIISRNSSNMGFLKNCNQAAAKARGKYILFLNNDTKVHENWLSSLVRLIESDDTIGMVGSKLVYPDGRLQEAGGIIWSDASGWNYGRLDDPEKAEYNYVKDVDYISGAAIMIGAELWKEIGGFDEYFAPAYCEDSDLAFEVRRHGKRVVYQPQSVVTHFEGISNGTDVLGTGLKRYQVVNQEKFREKWAAELKKQSVNTGDPDPFSARDRSQGKPCVAIIDHYVPTWDKDAGSKTTYQYIKMFLARGFNVKFIGDNFLHEEPYTSDLEQLGVEVLYGTDYRDGIFDYLKKNSKNIDFCYLNRPHIAVKYIDFIKKNTDIKCIFYGHDLHYLRIFREYELTGEIRKKRESDYWKSLEFSVMEQSDMVYYPSQVEIDEIHKFHPEIPAKAITAYVWDEFKEPDQGTENYDGREGILFVGGFKHPPNADAVKWFAESIWPLVKAEVPDIKFYVAGSGADEDILKLNDPGSGFEILGFVSDERLNELYETTRLVIVPLRYGAGVKGKVVEAIYNNSVVVTTSVGAEGIPQAENIMTVVDDDPDALFDNAERIAKDFAKAVIELYSDTERLSRMSAACGSYIREHYSYDAAWSVVEDDFKSEK
ncbi:MAG: glycosyltransferase [Eubacteriales bacterium]|nr:glycosyltransferase [Eubacteriales bacterium]